VLKLFTLNGNRGLRPASGYSLMMMMMMMMMMMINWSDAIKNASDQEH